MSEAHTSGAFTVICARIKLVIQLPSKNLVKIVKYWKCCWQDSNSHQC